MLSRFFDWLSALGNSKGLDLFNKAWMAITAVLLVLMIVGNVFKLGPKKVPEKSAPISEIR